MKRLIAMTCLATALLTILQMNLPMTAEAAGTENTAAIREEFKASYGDDPTEQLYAQTLRENSKRLADIATIRAKYAGSKEIDMLAKLIYREARGVKSDTEKAAVVWCVLNRVDDSHHPNTIKKVITQKHQFAWKNNTPVKKEFKELALDVVIRWELEKLGYENVGRVLPSGYLYFAGRKGHNWFRNKYRSKKYWDWSLDSPYDSNVALLSVGSTVAGAK